MCLIQFLHCPFCHKDGIENAASDDKQFCIQRGVDGEMKLKNNHQYFYQVSVPLSIYGSVVNH